MPIAPEDLCSTDRWFVPHISSRTTVIPICKGTCGLAFRTERGARQLTRPPDLVETNRRVQTGLQAPYCHATWGYCIDVVCPSFGSRDCLTALRWACSLTFTLCKLSSLCQEQREYLVLDETQSRLKASSECILSFTTIGTSFEQWSLC
jgi:hypothetical protein